MTDDEVSEAKAKKAKKDYDGDGKVETGKDEVIGSRRKAAGLPFKEGRNDYTQDEMVAMLSGKKTQQQVDADAEKTRGPDKGAQWAANNGGSQRPPAKPVRETSAKKCNHTAKGKSCPVHGMKECSGMAESKPSAGMSKDEKSTVAKKAQAGKDIGKPGKSFDKVAKSAGGAKGTKIAAAAMWKNAAK
jgi:hypothetical protein